MLLSSSLNFVQQDFPNSRVTLTGYSLGGYWAMYASMRSGIASVDVFNPGRGPALSNYNNPNQVTVVVSGELIGDPNTGLGSRVPGKLYGVDFFKGSPNLAGDLGSHDLDGMIGGLTAQALNKPVTTRPSNSTSSNQSQMAPGSLNVAPASRPPIPAVYGPGGISLSKAAAARAPINIALDGIYYKDGRLVLSGQPGIGFWLRCSIVSHGSACRM